MKLLHANDQRGEHAPSWYLSGQTRKQRPALTQSINTDVCVIGAGFTGLSTALELSSRGISTTVLDAHCVGWGASGRNGGQLGSGYNKDQQALEKLVGRSEAQALWRIAEDAKQHIKQLCQRHQIDIDYKPGIIYAQHRRQSMKAMQDYCAFMNHEYGYTALEVLNGQALRERVASDCYHGGMIDYGAGHVHPIKLAFGLANAAEQLGATIYERSEAIQVSPHHSGSGYYVQTENASVACEKVVYAANGYLDDLQPNLDPLSMPINNFIIVTEPLGDQADALLPNDNAVADSKFVVNYFRRVDNDRLLFGGGENYRYQFPSNITQTVRRAMLEVFPQLEHAGIDYSWGGTLAITRNRLPYLRQPSPDSYAAGGYSGHGVALSVIYGTAIAEHISGQADRFNHLATLPHKLFPGGKASRPALLALAMSVYSWLDKR